MNKNRLVAQCTLFVFIAYRYILMWLRVNNIVTDFLIIAAILFSFILLFGKKLRKKEINFILLILLFIIISYIHGRTIDIIVSLIIAIFYMNIENSIDNFIKDFTITSAFFYLMTLLLNSLGIIEQVGSSRLVNGSVDIRNSLGFIHVNSTFLYFIPIFLGILYINKSKSRNSKIFTIAVLDIISIVLYSISLCRTGIIIVFIINLIILFRKFVSSSKMCDFLSKYAYVYLPILLILLYRFTANDFSNHSINQLLSLRPYYITQALNAYNFSLLGNDIANTFIVDCAYIKILLNFGILSYVMMAYLNIKSYELLKKDFWLKLIYLVFIMYQIFENNYLYQTNFLMVIQFLLLIKYENRKEKHTNEISKKNLNNSTNV